MARAGYSCGLAVLLLLFGSRALQNAVAEGDTRTISMHHMHTDEDITITFKRDGRYDEDALKKLNWFLRDWRLGEQTRMDPHLIDLVWEVQREAGSKEPIWVVCGYRSPQTNAMLRRRSSGVARFSQHMLGKAMDFYIPGVALDELRAYGLRLQRGGVGFYPTSGSPFVHMDTGGIRMWPRMTHEQLVRVFPDGRTVHVPSDGRPLAGYALALAEIKKRGDSPSDNSLDAARDAGADVATANTGHASLNAFAKLLGLAKNKDKDEDDEDTSSAVPAAATTPAPATRTKLKPVVVAALRHGADKTVAAVRTVAAEAPKLIHSVATSVAAAVTPNQIILSRGYWQGLPDGMTAATPAGKSSNPLAEAPRARRTELASADATGSVSPWTEASEDRVPPTLALAYAEQAEQPAPASAVSTAAAAPAVSTIAATTRAAVAQVGRLIGEKGTTIALKGVIDQPEVAYQKATEISSTAVKVGARFDNPWLRAIVLSPSVHHFLTTLALGARDFKALAALMVKPASAVMGTFSTDPTFGLTHDHFSGNAIVFVPTVTYAAHTAALQQ